MKPTEKAPAIEAFLESLGFEPREDAHNKGTCVSCKGDAMYFTDLLSIKENSISGLCQKCQDEVFGG